MILDVVKIGATVLEKLFPDPVERNKHKIALMELEQRGELDSIKAQKDIIVNDASSSDPWVSRARPSFLYVVYFIILLCPLGGLLSVWFPSQVTTVADNTAALFTAIPEQIIWLFGTGYLGYTGARSFDKRRK